MSSDVCFALNAHSDPVCWTILSPRRGNPPLPKVHTHEEPPRPLLYHIPLPRSLKVPVETAQAHLQRDCADLDPRYSPSLQQTSSRPTRRGVDKSVHMWTQLSKHTCWVRASAPATGPAKRRSRTLKLQIQPWPSRLSWEGIFGRAGKLLTIVTVL